jgi:hypothetical protein
MRRQDRALPPGEGWRILAQADHGVLATVGPGGAPYAVPLNHVLVGEVLYFHGATEGHKLDNLAGEDRVSYCAVTLAEVLPAELSTRYESAIAFGRARLVLDPGERRAALEALLGRFAPGHPEEGAEAMASWGPRTAVVRMDVDHISAKRHS